jgi:hypothetical protein
MSLVDDGTSEQKNISIEKYGDGNSRVAYEKFPKDKFEKY